MNEVIVTKINSSYVRIEADEDTLHDINSYFAVYADGYMFNPRYKARVWDGKIRFFSINTGLLPAGLVPTLERYCNANNIDFKNDLSAEYESEYDEQKFKEICDIALKESGMTMRDYQEAACKLALQKKVRYFTMLYFIW